MKATFRTLAGITLIVAGSAIFGTGCSQESSTPSTTSTAQAPAVPAASSDAVAGPPSAAPSSNGPLQSPEEAKADHQSELMKQSQYWIAHGQGSQPLPKKTTEKPKQ